MTDEVTPTRDAELAEVEALIAEEQRNQIGFCAVDFQLMVRVASRLRTPQVEAYDELRTMVAELRANYTQHHHMCNFSLKPPHEKPCNCGTDDLRERAQALLIRTAALSRRPSEAVDGVRGEAKCGFCNDRKVIGVPGKPCPACAHVIDAPSRRLTADERSALEVGAYALDSSASYASASGHRERYESLRERAATLRALADRLASEDGAAVGAAGAWVPWKAGDPKPAGEHHLTTVHRFCVDRLQIVPTKDFAKNGVTAYWTIDLPPVYTPSPPEGGRT